MGWVLLGFFALVDVLLLGARVRTLRSRGEAIDATIGMGVALVLVVALGLFMRACAQALDQSFGL